MKSIWVLTSNYNMYDQQGEYFIAAWEEKPTLKDLKDLKNISIDDFMHHNLLKKGNCGTKSSTGGERYLNLSQKILGKSYNQAEY